MLVPTVCFNCESACGLTAYVDKQTFEIKKLEGNPHHPGSRGRNCAKGPATINQVHDPERILYPLRRKPGPRAAAASGSGSAGTTCSTRSPSACTRRSRAGGRTTSCTSSAAPARTASPSGSWRRGAADGHNSHTNVCSSGGRTGYGFWSGTDRPSPDYANARFMLLISAHLESGHYFNPHAQRIIEGRSTVRRSPSRPAAVEHRGARRLLAADLAGDRGGGAAGDRAGCCSSAAGSTASSSAAG